MNKKLFIVSNNRKLWSAENKNLFIVDPYVYHVLEKNGELQNFSNIEVCDYRRKSKEDLINESTYIDKKYEKYLPILASRLNEINGKNYSIDFWKKSLSLGLVRYITTFHNIYQNIELKFNIENHNCNILTESSYFTPNDFEDHRYCFEFVDFGVEQILSIYLRLFYKESKFKSIEDKFIDNTYHVGLKRKSLLLEKSRIKAGIAKIFKLIRHNPKEFIQNHIIKFTERRKATFSKIEIGICGSFFSDQNYNNLVKLSYSKILKLDWSLRINLDYKTIQYEKRLFLSSPEDDFDRFDLFFFTTLIHCFPKAFIENFHSIENKYIEMFQPYTNLKYIISEQWMSNTYLSICLALNQLKGVKHITNEHNSLFHPFAGSFIKYVTRLSDIFITIGWDDHEIPNLIKGASLYPFKINQISEKKIKILYISGSTLTRISHYHSLYLTGEEGVPKTISYLKSFFGSLSSKTLSEITYRPYPKQVYLNLSYDREYLLGPILEQVNMTKDFSVSSKSQMITSSLIIIDYLSTAWLEALFMNIPTIVLWNPETLYLNDDFSDFLNPLLEVGICQKDPVKAAAFLEEIKDNPGKWWFSDFCSNGRKQFIDKNLGDPGIMIDYILSLLNEKKT